ncbi:MAG: class I SAM-dependent methyltransferase [Chitinophagales bacterium]|nr:class I SAM-dependent methyltransferase [Chitinophagaceae bacterium]MCB9064482.1 class I SAM-dependent methyltransferase [Chitinophagales bacterium]
MKQFWNERYTEQDDIYGTEPNVFFKQELDKLQPGTLLLPGEGEARNAIYAAKKGWQVTAFDSSEVAVQKGLENAAKAGVSINYINTTTEGFTADPVSFDVVAMIYIHMQPDIRNVFHKKVIGWLKPGGTLILEGFNTNQLDKTSGGPKDINMLYTIDMLQNDFNVLNIETLHTTIETLEEGAFHSGEAELIRLVASKKA